MNQLIRVAVAERVSARITARDVFSWLAVGMTEQQILDDYPELEADDFRAVYEFAAQLVNALAV